MMTVNSESGLMSELMVAKQLASSPSYFGYTAADKEDVDKE